MNLDWNCLKPPLHKCVLSVLKRMAFPTMTPVQAACIPLLMTNKDVAAEAVTGSGKTLAFIIPLLQILIKYQKSLRKHDIGALVIAPTRELAQQINDVLSKFLDDLTDFSHLCVVGGNNPALDIQKFKENGAHIVIGTPGRLVDLLERKESSVTFSSGLRALEVLIMDEADQLLDLGFEASLNTILSYLPKQRRTSLFSATQTDEVECLIRAGLRNPVRAIVKQKSSCLTVLGEDQRTPTELNNLYMIIPASQKLNQLISFLKQHKNEKILVFFATCASVDYFYNVLRVIMRKLNINCIHGKRNKRERLFKNFKKSKSGVLLSTDVMSRGVDIVDVGWVVQFDAPTNARAFVHRCGRTARIGHQGTALVFLMPNEDSYITFIERNQQVPLKEVPIVEAPNDYTEKVRSLSSSDRLFYSKGIRAFVSYIQSYSKHECQLIFQIKDLDIVGLARSYGLLHLPKMPELKSIDTSNFVALDIDTNSIAFREPQMEAARLQELETGNRKFKRKLKPLVNMAWSKQKRKHEKKLKRQETKQKKKHKLEKTDDADDVNNDFALLKRVKKGKISEEDFVLLLEKGNVK